MFAFSSLPYKPSSINTILEDRAPQVQGLLLIGLKAPYKELHKKDLKRNNSQIYIYNLWIWNNWFIFVLTMDGWLEIKM